MPVASVQVLPPSADGVSLAATLPVMRPFSWPLKLSSTAVGAWFGGAATAMVTLAVEVPALPLPSVYVNEIEPDTSWLGVKVSVPSPFIVTVPCGRVTDAPGAIGWPATATIVIAVADVSLPRGSKVTGVLLAVDSVSAWAIGAEVSGAMACACGAAVGTAIGVNSCAARPVTDSLSRPTRSPSSRLPAAPPLFGPAAGTTSASPWPTCEITRSTSSPAAASCVREPSIWTMPSCAVRTTSPLRTTSPTCSGRTSPSSRRTCASPQTPSTLPASWRTGT